MSNQIDLVKQIRAKSKAYFREKYPYCWISVEPSSSNPSVDFALVGYYYKGNEEVYTDFYLSQTDLEANKQEIDYQEL